ncbi:MAG: FHA domain-containing protein [Pirellulaceae bacterium]|nr:FHA domain-containing protein [Pirellulaceae bacterium]
MIGRNFFIMLTPWRFKLREAQVALEQGRLEEAAQIVGEADLRQYLPVRQLLGQIALKTAERGLARAKAGDLAAGWRDLDAARALAGESTDWSRFRQALAELAISDIVHHLQAGDYAGATSRIESLDKRNIPGTALGSLLEITRRLDSARKLGHRGKYPEAVEQLAAAETLRPDLPLIAEQKQLYQQRAERSRTLMEQLHAAIAASEWTKVVAIASELIELSPDNRVARDARKRAWAEVGERIGDSRRLGDTHHWAGGSSDERAPPKTADAAAAPKAPRFMLWIDAVGGFLVCLGDEIVVGQSGPSATADVPIQADISRQHIKIRREGEGYVLEPLAPKVRLEGKTIASLALLSDGDEITLGDAVRLRFRKPHVLSASARLELLTPHRTQPFADAVLLMAESCVLGPKWQNHVVCRDWGGDVVLYRQDDKVFCRAMESIEIDGELCDGRGAVKPGSHVLGTDFSLSLEGV